MKTRKLLDVLHLNFEFDGKCLSFLDFLSGDSHTEMRARTDLAAPLATPQSRVLATTPAAFVPMQLPPAKSASPDIRIELRRGATSVAWPADAAAECAAWMRELLR